MPQMYEHYDTRDEGLHSHYDRANVHCSQPVKRVKISGNKKRVITSSVNAPRNGDEGPTSFQRFVPVGHTPTRRQDESQYIGQRPNAHRPTYPKISRKYLDEDTLKYYSLPYDEYKNDGNYLLIHRELDQQELERLFEHTKRLRQRRERWRSPTFDSRHNARRSRSRSDRSEEAEEAMSTIEVIEVHDEDAYHQQQRARREDEARRMKQHEALEILKMKRELHALRESKIEEEQQQGRRASGLDHPQSEKYSDDDDDNNDDGGDNDDDDANSLFDLDDGLLPFALTNMIANSSDDKIINSNSSPGPARDPVKSGPIQQLDILSSNWQGSVFDEFRVGAQLHTISAPSAKTKTPIIRWLHMERPAPSWEEFLSAALHNSSLPRAQMRRLEALLTQIQSDNEQQRQHGRDMKAFCEADVDMEGFGTAEKQTSSFVCMSIPLFALEKHMTGPVRSLVAGSPYHPSRPLLQTHTRMLNDKREMSQAITELGTTPQGHCLHVQSIWCLALNEDTILTCSKLPVPSLSKSLVFRSELANPSEPTISLRAGNHRLWRFPATAVSSLPRLISMLADSASDLFGHDARAGLLEAGKSIGSSDLKQLGARFASSDLALTLGGERERTSGSMRLPEVLRRVREKVGVAAATTAGGRDGVATPDRDLGNGSPLTGMHNDGLGLCVLAHSARREQKAIIGAADGLDQFLTRSKYIGREYTVCAEATRHDIDTWLKQFSSPAGREQRRQLSKTEQQLAETKVVIALLAVRIFDFFWNRSFDHLLTRKFWGALQAILDHGVFSAKDHILHEAAVRAATDFSSYLVTHLFDFLEMFENAYCSSTDDLQALPEPFYKSWLYVQTAFIMAATSKSKKLRTYSWRDCEVQIRRAREALESGEAQLTARLRTHDIEDYEVCSTRGILALILDCVTRDVMNGKPDVPQTYDSYCRQLEAKMVADPFPRVHQETLRALQQELEAILAVLKQQLEVVTYFGSSIRDLDTDVRLPDLSFLHTFRQDNVLQQCRSNIASRIDQFEALQNRATDLGEWHLAEIDTNKDRQEAAIMVFTIVTIIFLPLSFVSGVFGMNTVDVRDMSQGQWAYWAAALPLTIIVVGASLWFAGAFEGWKEWLPRRTPGGRGGASGRYERIPEPVVISAKRAEPSHSYRHTTAVYPRVRSRTSYPVKRSGTVYGH